MDKLVFKNYLEDWEDPSTVKNDVQFAKFRNMYMGLNLRDDDDGGWLGEIVGIDFKKKIDENGYKKGYYLLAQARGGGEDRDRVYVIKGSHIDFHPEENTKYRFEVN